MAEFNAEPSHDSPESIIPFPQTAFEHSEVLNVQFELHVKDPLMNPCVMQVWLFNAAVSQTSFPSMTPLPQTAGVTVTHPDVLNVQLDRQASVPLVNP